MVAIIVTPGSANKHPERLKCRRASVHRARAVITSRRRPTRGNEDIRGLNGPRPRAAHFLRPAYTQGRKPSSRRVRAGAGIGQDSRALFEVVHAVANCFGAPRGRRARGRRGPRKTGRLHRLPRRARGCDDGRPRRPSRELSRSNRWVKMTRIGLALAVLFLAARPPRGPPRRSRRPGEIAPDKAAALSALVGDAKPVAKAELTELPLSNSRCPNGAFTLPARSPGRSCRAANGRDGPEILVL